MNWIENINNALEFIENNLKSDIDMEKLAREANSSRFHFSRVFKIITNKTVKEYIRERRITVATKELVTSDIAIAKLSEKYLYESPAAFSKAFKRFNGVSPVDVKSKNSEIVASPKLEINLSIRGSEKIRYRIQSRESFYVYGIKRSVRKNTDDIIDFWKETLEKDPRISNQLTGVTYNWFPYKENDTFSYIIGNQAKILPEENKMAYINIPESKWAIFILDSFDIKKIGILWEQIFKDWFPATNYIQSNKPVLEVMGSNSFEIWLPIACNT